MWDNRQTMHRARPFPASEPRDMRRTTLMGEGPTVPPVAAWPGSISPSPTLVTP
jgi:alpha-ketoglutarate-dependent 2,4-dichlorophenoxyacetate dioxygenase